MNNKKVRKSKINEKIEKAEKKISAEQFIDSDTSQDTSRLTSIRQRQLQDQLMQHQSSKDVVSNELHLFKKQVVQQIENQILNSQKRLEEQLHEELEVFEKSINKTLTEIREQHYYEIKSEEVRSRERSMEKIFKYKPSLLSEMMKQSDYKTLYHMIVASMFALMMNLWVQDYVQQSIIFDMDTFFWCFQNPILVATIWCGLTLSCYLSVYWIHFCYNHKVNPVLGVTVFSIHQSAVILYACSITIHLVYGFGSRMIVMCEAVRMIMKNYSYARNKMLYGTNNNRKYYITNYWLTKGITNENVILPDITVGTLSQEFNRYTYFFFAPTLLYRDHYVKAPHQSKRKIIIEFSNFFLCIYYGFILFRTFCKQPILDLRENLTLTNFILTLFKLMMPSTFSLVLVFFGLLHSWFNGWAELLRFPDRTFYLDWWSSSEFGQYYRKWNVVVHEFLYYYVYLDSDKLSRGKRSKLFSQFVTFGASAIIHEIILTVAMGFFFPICFLLFTGPGILFINQGKKLVKKSWVNIIFWLQLYLGTSLMITLYLTEYYARQRIDDDKMYNIWGIFHHLIPRTIYLITGTSQ